MLLCDSHVHLASPKFAGDVTEVIARADGAGVGRLVTCGTDLKSSESELAIAQAHAGVYAAIGIHGHAASSALVPSTDDAGAPVLDESLFARLAALAHRAPVVAIGEIGLDYHYDLSPREVQRSVLTRQLRLAAEAGLPVILHNRESDNDMVRVIEAGPHRLRGVLHCFLADRALADWAVARGLYIGVAGPLTFRNVRSLSEVISSVPRDRLLIETDSPYLAPHPWRGRRNEPAFVVRVAERLAEVLGMTLEQVAERTTENTFRLFGLG